MFCCCCPSLAEQQKKNQIKQSLLLSNQIKSQSNNLKQLNSKSKKIYNSKNNLQYLQIKNQNTKCQQSKNTNTEIDNQKQLKGIIPYFHSNDQSPTQPKPQQKDQRKWIQFSKKSHLFRQQIKSDLIYLNLKVGEQIYISYRIIKNQQIKQYLNILDYYLSKLQDKIHVIICKQAMIYRCLLTLNKYNHNLVIINYGRIIDIQDNINNIQLIMTKNLRNIKWNRIDSLLVVTDGLYNYQNVKGYFNNFIKDLKLDQFKKTTFIFPGFMTLQNISELLYSCMKQYVINSTLQKVSLDLAFDMQLIECVNLDSFIIIKSRTQENKSINSVYDHLKTSMVMFGKDLTDDTQKIYRDFYIKIKEKTLEEYFVMKELYRRNPVQFRVKVAQMRDFDQNTLANLQNANEIKQYQCQNSGFYYVIHNKVREDIGRIFHIPDLQKKQIDTPVKKEWDDSATAQDFKTVRSKKLDHLEVEELNKIDFKMGWMDVDQILKNQQNQQQIQQLDFKNVTKRNTSQVGISSGYNKSNWQFSRNRIRKGSKQDYSQQKF